MTFYSASLIFVLVVLCSNLIIYSVREFSIRKKILDIPNNRSSHSLPTPKGGGLSIVIIMIVTIILLSCEDLIAIDITMAMIIGLIIVSLTGLVDDLINLSVWKRVLAYLTSISISLYFVGGLDDISINNYSVHLSYAGYLASLFFLFWLVNLYNFMDGTDGFAAIQTISVSLFICYLLFMLNDMPLFILFFCLIVSTTVFLFWNWFPAKIFMGDVGSCSIGFLFGLFAVYTASRDLISLSVWVILLSPFIGDATFTLLKRILKKEQWYKAHNSHAYQKIYQSGYKHNELAFSLLVLNIIIVWPCAYLANYNKNLELAMIMLSYGIIGIIWYLAQNNCLNRK